MDLFGRKRIRELEADLERALLSAGEAWQHRKEEVELLTRANTEHIRTIRDMDQLIFTMGQQIDWLSMRSYFIELLKGTRTRMDAESSRIRDVLIPELRKTYNEPKRLK